MKKRRIIPVILLKEGQIVQSKQFKRHQNIGDPFKSVSRYSEWNADELIYLNISPDHLYSQNHRSDINSSNYSDFSELTNIISHNNLCPITIGGGIKSLDDVNELFKNGADKISFCSQVIDHNYQLFNQISNIYGCQALVAVLDIIKIDETYFLYDYRTKKALDITLVEMIRNVENWGFGEIVVQDVLQDGRKRGYDIDLFKLASDSTNLPVVALGGAGSLEDFDLLFENTNVDAVAAANFFQHQELSVINLRKFLSINKKHKYIRI